ncbi:MAG: glycosyltransferase family 39 protein [Chthonomonadales bacterium]
MISLGLLVVLCLCAAMIGRRCLVLCKVSFQTPLLDVVGSAALGFGCIGYAVLAVGLMGLLTPLWVSLVIAILTACSWRSIGEVENEFRNPTKIETGSSACIWLKRGAITTFVLIAAAALVNCFVPPAGHEWDALAYHLAAPSVYISHHQILYLPTDHHSNFPFLVEMLFTIGLLFDGHALANLFHFTMGALTVAGTIGIGRRYFSPTAGWIAGLVVATTPIFIWEAGSAYIELGMALYVLLAVGTCLEYLRTREPRWLLVAGILAGFALGTKALALVPFVGIAVMLLVNKTPIKQFRRYLIAAVVIGSPFYLKSIVYTGNPVYPFAYRLFGGKYWNTDLADAYAGSQKAFGLRQEVISAADDLKNIRPAEATPTMVSWVRNLFIAPFELINIPRIYYDYFDPGFLNHIGFLWMALPPIWILTLTRRRAQVDHTNAGTFVASIAGIWLIIWALSMQYVRYLIPLLPLCALIGGEGIHRLTTRNRWTAPFCFLAVGFQAIAVIWIFLPNVPEQAARAFDPDAQLKYLTNLNIYSASKWLNESTDTNEGVVLYEEARGYYLKRPYLWGNALHSLYIPYSTMKNGREMVDWFMDHGIHYALINLKFSPMNQGTPENEAEYKEAASTGKMEELFLKWYNPKLDQGEKWRRMIGEAVVLGAATVVPEASVRHVVVLQFHRAAK